MGEYVEHYCNNEYRNLKKLVDPIISKFGIPPCDYDDFYSLAAGVCWECDKQYDPGRGVPFEPYFRVRLRNKILTKITARNRNKRINKFVVADKMTGEKKVVLIHDIRLDAPYGEDGEYTIGDIIPAKTDLESEVIEERQEQYSEKMMSYLNRLSDVQREVLKLISEGFSQADIISELHISNKEYLECNAAIHSYRNVSVLF